MFQAHASIMNLIEEAEKGGRPIERKELSVFLGLVGASRREVFGG